MIIHDVLDQYMCDNRMFWENILLVLVMSTTLRIRVQHAYTLYSIII